jgi:SAM-dependent methyltransferase
VVSDEDTSGAGKRRRLTDWLGMGRKGGWRPRTDPVRGRRRALKEEVGYWDHWLATRGGKYAPEFAERFDPAAEVTDPALRTVLGDLEKRAPEVVSILDVGAGPASTVGHRFCGRPVEVTAVDPLADHYRRLLNEHGLEPPVLTERLQGEQLVERFGRGQFDVAYARNALDHAVDPVAIAENMLEVVRPGGYVVLRHVRNEAVRQRWIQLHQWNFDERDGRLVVWRPGVEIDMAERLATATISCYTEASEEPGVTWVVAVIPRSGSQELRVYSTTAP